MKKIWFPFHGFLIYFLLISACATKPSPSDQDRPNLLIIHTDEHNFRTLGCYRNLLPDSLAYVWGKDVKAATPNIDFLADHGAICTSYYAATPVCSPSRASFMTGRFPQNTDIVTNDIPMDGSMITFAEVLGKQGYKTGYAGKWHLDGEGKPQWTPQRKFGFQDNRYMYNRGHWKKMEDGAVGPKVASVDKQGNPDYRVNGADSLSYTTDFLARKTMEFIKSHKQEPFCFMVSMPDPHGPNTVRPPYDTMYRHLNFEKPQSFIPDDAHTPKWAAKARKTITPEQQAKYFGMVKCIDDNIGKILKTLRDNNLLQHTIVVFTSDHGDLLGEHGRDNKGVPFEGSARIPFVLYYPAAVGSHTVIDEALSTVDFQPTILQLMGMLSSGQEQGRNAARLFTKGKASAGWQDVAFMRGTGQRNHKPDINWLAAVTNRYKLVYSPVDVPWLFDLQEDPYELTNRYENADYKKVVVQLTQAILDYGEKNNDPRIHHAKMRAEMDKALAN